MAQRDDFEKTLPPSERKLEKAREEGQGLKVADLTLLIAAMGVVLGGFIIKDAMRASWQGWWDWAGLWSLKDGLNGGVIFSYAIRMLGLSLVPVCLGAGAASLFAWLIGGRIFSMKAITPDLQRLDPIARFGGLFKFGASNIFWPLIKGLATIALAILTSWQVFTMLAQGRVDSAGKLLAILAPLIGLFALFAFSDALVQWWRRRQELMMSYQEVKEEMKESEGNPQVKSRQRSLARERSRARMMAAVAKADVVIVNPEHFLVALAWNQEMDAAPRVVAKGLDALAMSLKARAKESGVPVLEAPPLARLLWANSKLGAQISTAHFRAIATVFAWVMSLRTPAPAKEPSLNDLMQGLPDA